jgi:hypothetical protein
MENDRNLEGLSCHIPGDVPITGVSNPTLLTVKQFCQQHPAFTQGGVRWLLFNRQENGLEHAVLKVGRRVLIDVDAFFGWIDEQNGR